MLTTARTTTAFVAVTIALALAACTASANFTVNADALATEVAVTLQREVDSDAPPHMYCGDESIDLVAGMTVLCELTVPDETAIWDTWVTITEVDGTEYAFDVQVAEEPN